MVIVLVYDNNLSYVNPECKQNIELLQGVFEPPKPCLYKSLVWCTAVFDEIIKKKNYV